MDRQGLTFLARTLGVLLSDRASEEELRDLIRRQSLE